MLCASDAFRVDQHTSLVGQPVIAVQKNCSIARVARLTRIEKSTAGWPGGTAGASAMRRTIRTPAPIRQRDNTHKEYVASVGLASQSTHHVIPDAPTTSSVALGRRRFSALEYFAGRERATAVYGRRCFPSTALVELAQWVDHKFGIARHMRHRAQVILGPFGQRAVTRILSLGRQTIMTSFTIAPPLCVSQQPNRSSERRHARQRRI